MSTICSPEDLDIFDSCLADAGFHPETENSNDNEHHPDHCMKLHKASCSCGTRASQGPGECREAMIEAMQCSLMANFGCDAGPCDEVAATA